LRHTPHPCPFLRHGISRAHGLLVTKRHGRAETPLLHRGQEAAVVANLISSMDRSSPLEVVSQYTVELIGHLTLNLSRPPLPSFCGVPFHHSSVGFSLVYPASFRSWRLEKVFTSAPSRRCPAQLHRRLLPLCLWLISLPSTPTTPFLAQFGAIAGSSRHGHATLVTTIHLGSCSILAS
jgi:hypothetical protein